MDARTSITVVPVVSLLSQDPGALKPRVCGVVCRLLFCAGESRLLPVISASFAPVHVVLLIVDGASSGLIFQFLPRGGWMAFDASCIPPAGCWTIPGFVKFPSGDLAIGS